MTVAELIINLQEFPPDLIVYPYGRDEMLPAHQVYTEDGDEFEDGKDRVVIA